MRTDRSPGPLLRLAALAAAAAAATVVVSAALELGRGHWGAALVALPLLVAVLVAAIVSYRRLVLPAAVAVGLMVAAIATGGLVAWIDANWAVGVHVTAAGGALAASLVTLVVSFRGEALPLGPWRDYVTLTKPRIMSLLLITGAGGMFVGAGGWPGAVELLTMLVGLALACGGASALNHVIDRDIDKLMGSRTAARPVASGRVPAPRALEFGLVLSALSFALLASTVNVLTAVLALVGNLFYVVVYTGYLKRSTDQNIVIGGAAGAVPPLVGYAAATGDLALPALWLFLIVFLWTPPHFWALALMIKDHYAAANVLTAVLALVGNLFYVVVYTGYLKRSTDQNIVIGGAAGAVPPLVGYAAATGSLALPALWLFLIVFLWTPPHFWALALMIKEHYAAASVPMLPGTKGDRETTRQILLYSIVMVAFTVAVGWWLGPVYTAAAVLLGAYFLLLAWQLRRDTSRRRAFMLFHYSLAYLALLFVAAAIDPMIV